MNKNYNKFYNKPENVKREPEVQAIKQEPEECRDGVCEVELAQKEEIIKVSESSIREVGNCEYLNVREEPSLDAKVLSVIKRGVTLTLLEPIRDDSEWVKVRVHKTGVEGFIMRDYTV